jgi:crotonobetainyl-CoA:carnitine CoA-transferase CaiB-like acyl-CoA transferase
MSDTYSEGRASGPPTPLNGIRVLDLTNVLAGPYCCYQLALMGAEVIKFERPGRGDLARQLGADPALNQENMGISFLAQNAQKRSMTLDLKSDDGKAVFKRLVRSADVVVENFRPGVMDRLGLGYPVLRAENPTLIYCAISGFGQDGPWKNDPAYDQIVQGISGVMSITGTPDSGPTRVGYPLADTIGGMTAAFGIAAALNETPRGRVIDLSMTESVLSTMGWIVSNYLIGGVVPGAHGNENTTSAPSGTFKTADSAVNISANKDEQWQALARHLGRGDLLADPRFTTREHRKANRYVLRDLLEDSLRQQTSAHWVAALTPLGIPTGPVLSVPEALASTQVSGRGLIAEGLPAAGREISVVGSPLIMDGERPKPSAPPPELSADTDDVLTELGLSAEDIAGLRQRNIV